MTVVVAQIIAKRLLESEFYQGQSRMRTYFKPAIGIASLAVMTLAPGLDGFQPALTAQPAVSASVMPWGGAAPKTVFQAKIKRRLSGIPVIDVTFNGNRKFEMIVDTGASSTLITRSMAGALQVRIVGSVRSGIANGSVVEFPVGRINSMSVDGAEVRNINVAIADQMPIGLLGHDFFGNYDMQIKQDMVQFSKRK